MILGFLSLKTIYVILHLLGVALGAGGAFTSDFMFFHSVKDKKIDDREIEFLKLGSRVVWLGIVILIVSGILLFSLDPVKYLNSAKFLAKMTIALVIIINGIIFHFVHMKNMIRFKNKDFSELSNYGNISKALLASGAVSSVSWISAIILGTLRFVPYSYMTIMSVYVGVLLVAIAIALLMRKKILW